MSIKLWYYKHFDRDKLLEELSKPVEGEYVVVREGNMLTRVKKEELSSYMQYLSDMKKYYEEAYNACARDHADIIKTSINGEDSSP